MANFFSNLNDNYGVLKVSGNNVTNFLQGQLTCNLQNISELGTIGARCSAKGRVVSVCYIFYYENCFYLIVPTDLLPKQQQDLAKYALFSKCKVEITNDFTLFGIANKQNDLTELLPFTNIVRITDNLYISACLKNNEQQIFTKLQQNYPEQPLNKWYLTQIKAGIAYVNLTTSEQFVPQMLNLPEIGAVSFDKGCYMGQEVVARMQYLGKPKRQMYRIAMLGDNCQIGAELLNAEQKAVGKVILGAKCNLDVLTNNSHNLMTNLNRNYQYELLAVLDNKYISAPIYLNNEPVNILNLPYSINNN